MEGHWSAQQPSTNLDGTSASATNRSHCILHQASEIQQQRVYEQEKIISAPLDYLSNIPGKDVRGKFIAAFDQIFQIPEERLSIIKHVIELLHLASLLIDDIEDSATLRRGFPVAHSIFGIAQTINSSNYVYFRAQSELLRLNRPEAFKIFTEELLCLHRGQGMDLHWRDSLTCPSEADYLEMVSNKTGGLFRLAIKLMQLESSVHIDCVPLVNILGIMFQIRDDYQNLQSYEYAENKGFAEDITEGKFSYPIIHSIHSTPGNWQLISVLRQKPEDKAIKEFAIQVIESTGSFEYCRKKLKTLGKEASQMLETLRVSNTKGLYDILDFLLIS